MDHFVALVVTYLVASAVSFAIYFIQGTGEAGWKKDIFTINPAALGLGAAIVGIELGNVYMYQAGWTVNTAFIVANGLIVLALMVMGTLLYGEKITPRKILGVVISMAGIAAITLG